MAINRLRQPEDALLSKWGFKKPRLPVLNNLHPLSFGLSGLWLTGGATSGLIYDLSENENDGRIVNGPLTTNVPSLNNGYASYFSIVGTPNEYVDCGPSPLLKGDPALTACCWVNYNGSGAFPRILANLDSINGYAFLAYDLNTFPSWSVRKGGIITDLTDSIILARNIWQFLCGTYDGTTSRFYVNGVQVAFVGASGALGSSTNNLLLASDPNVQPSATNNYPGGLEAVRIYNRALTAAEVLQLYIEPYAGIYDAIADRKVVGSTTPASAGFSYSEIWG